MKIVDAHCHYTRDMLNTIKTDEDLFFLLCGGNDDQWLEISSLHRQFYNIKGSFGIHPCNAEQYEVSDFKYYYPQCHVIGEIGLDNCWCDVDIVTQRKRFIQQLELARIMKKPVIIHCKGMEREVIDILKDYSMPKIIHWYSSKDYLDEYIAQDCYFTIGPSYDKDDAVKNVIEKVSIDRLLVESDGVEGIKWARGESYTAEDVRKVLEDTIKYIAEVKGLSLDETATKLFNNFINIVG